MFTSQELLFTLPEPRQITLTGGMTELSEDVRLVTSNVLPLYRKTMRTVLASAGIRVVANKKKFIIDIRVEKPEALDLSEVPEAAREEYYEIDLQDNAVIVRTASQLGALWGTHTLAGIYKAKGRGLEIPNLRLLDWPDHLHRATTLDSVWGMERLTPEEWTVVFERLSSVKINAVGLPLDGGRSAATSGSFAEGLITPFADQPEANREGRLSWYTPNLKSWKNEKLLPKFHTTDVLAGDYLKQILNMSRENGQTPFPVLSALGGETPIPALFPKTAASGGGLFCLSAPETRATLDAFWGGLLTRFFAEGAVYAMLHVALPGATTLCSCPKCKKKKPEQTVQEHLVWAAGILAAKGVKHILVRDGLPAALSATVFSPALAKELQKAKLAGKVILIAPPPAAKAKKGAAGDGLTHWSAPAIAPAVWTRAEAAGDLIAAGVPAGFADGLAGTLLPTVWDTQSYDLIANFANLAWRSQTPVPSWRSAADIFALCLGHDAPAYLEARELLAAAVLHESPLTPAFTRSPFLAALFPRIQDGGFDIGAGIDALAAAKTVKAVRAHLAKLEPAAAAAQAKLAAILDREQKPAEIETVRGMLCDAIRVGGLAKALGQLLNLRAMKPDAKMLKAVQDLHASLLETITLIETRRNKLTAPLRLAEFSPLLGLTEQMIKELQEGKKGDAPAWTWNFPVIP